MCIRDSLSTLPCSYCLLRCTKPSHQAFGETVLRATTYNLPRGVTRTDTSPRAHIRAQAYSHTRTQNTHGQNVNIRANNSSRSPSLATRVFAQAKQASCLTKRGGDHSS
eukprot:4800322-Amphidinium_carterae.1